MKRIDKSGDGGKPLFLTDTANSVIEVMSYDHFKGMNHEELVGILASKNIVVTGSPVPEAEFDEAGLETLTSFHLSVPLLGAFFLSFRFCSSEAGLLDYSASPLPANVIGPVSDLLECGKDGSRILNGLEFPMLDASIELNAYSSDLAAWKATSGAHTCPRKAEYPKVDMRWGLAGTANTISFLHLDSDGFNTFLKVLCGLKLWAFYRECETYGLPSIDVFTTKSFLLDDISEDSDFGLEAVVLKRGDFV